VRSKTSTQAEPRAADREGGGQRGPEGCASECGGGPVSARAGGGVGCCASCPATTIMVMDGSELCSSGLVQMRNDGKIVCFQASLNGVKQIF
jgi:hypothetical protein